MSQPTYIPNISLDEYQILKPSESPVKKEPVKEPEKEDEDYAYKLIVDELNSAISLVINNHSKTKDVEMEIALARWKEIYHKITDWEEDELFMYKTVTKRKVIKCTILYAYFVKQLPDKTSGYGWAKYYRDNECYSDVVRETLSELGIEWSTTTLIQINLGKLEV